MEKPKAKLTDYRCALCGERLREGQWIFSRFTRNRYHPPGHCRGERRKTQGGS